MILTTIDKSRKALSLLMNSYEKEKDADPVKFRNLVHSFSVLLTFFKLEKDLRMEEDLEEIKEILIKQGLL